MMGEYSGDPSGRSTARKRKQTHTLRDGEDGECQLMEILKTETDTDREQSNKNCDNKTVPMLEKNTKIIGTVTPISLSSKENADSTKSLSDTLLHKELTKSHSMPELTEVKKESPQRMDFSDKTKLNETIQLESETTSTSTNEESVKPRRARAAFSEKLRELLNSPDYGDGMGSKLRMKPRKSMKRRKSVFLELRPMHQTTKSHASENKSLDWWLSQSNQTYYQKPHHSQVADNDVPNIIVQTSTRGETGEKTKQHSLSNLAGALGIASEELGSDRVKQRRHDIQLKIKFQNQPTFTMEEEYDIHCRAESFANSIVPDPDYYIVGNELSASTSQDTCSKSGGTDGKERGVSVFESSATRNENLHPPARKRRRHLSMVDSCKVAAAPYSLFYPDINMNYVTLANGVQLLKPPVKLVELVAQAINDSPDALLQVQQVYIVLQQRYPFFQYLDKTSLTSWRSSIRHALYQKWFLKVQFLSDLINCRGCYWAINRRHHPREWALPPDRHAVAMTSSGKLETFDIAELTEDWDVTVLADTDIDDISFDQEFPNEDPDDIFTSPLLDPHRAEISPSQSPDAAVPTGRCLLSPSSRLGGTVCPSWVATASRDPDPMLHTLGLSQTSLTAEVPTVECGGDREDGTEWDTDGCSSSSSSSSTRGSLTTEPCDTSHLASHISSSSPHWLLSPLHSSDNDSGNYGSLSPWIPTFDDKSPSPRLRGKDVDPSASGEEGLGELPGPGLVGFVSVVLPDIEKLGPEEIQVCMQQPLPHDEHW